MDWLLLILSLPTGNATARQRAWRALKASGAAVLRDGVYVLPGAGDARPMLEQIASTVREAGGMARVLAAQDSAPGLQDLFDRGPDYQALREEIALARRNATADSGALRQVRKLRRSFDTLAQVDFFPGRARDETAQALRDLELSIARASCGDEPPPEDGAIPRRTRGDFQGRQWATRRRPWVDRLASAWLVRRFIDREARFLWLADPADCPPAAVGFDFEGAAFTHVGARVTFEVLVEGFQLQEPALQRLGQLVHHLDVGGTAPADAAGIENLLAGLRDTHADDDALLAAASAVFDALYASYRREAGGA